MYIKTIEINNHKILGSFCFDTDKSIEHPKDNGGSGNRATSMRVEMSKNAKGMNHYTFIIGANGSGKTTLVQNVMSYIFMHEPSLTACVARTSSNLARLFEGGLTGIDKKRGSFLQSNGDLRVLHVSADKTFISEEMHDGYMEVSPIERDVSLRMLPCIYRHDYNLSSLCQLLGYEDPVWEQSFSFGEIIEGLHEITNDGYNYILNGSQSINILRFLRFVDVILNPSTFNKERDEAVHHDIGSFMAINTPWKSMDGAVKLAEYQRLFTGSNIIKQLRKFFEGTNYVDDENSTKRDSAVVVVNNYEDKKDLFNLDFFSLTAEDVELIPVLVKMGVLDYHVSLNGIPLDSMSSGERNMIKMYSVLAAYVNKGLNNMLIIIDEPENSLHPQWQQQYPFLLHSIMENIYHIKDSHIIINTHSPLIIQNVYENAEKVDLNVYKLERKKGVLNASKIEDCNRYCIEELMMDQFGIGYRNKEAKTDVLKFLDERKSNLDPINAVYRTEGLKQEIDQLYQQVLQL